VIVDAEATCLSVSGRVATVGLTGTFHQGGQGFDAWVEGLIRVVDAGGAASGADTVEVAYRTADLSGPPPAGPATCSAFPGPFGRDSFFFPDFTNATGDLVVTDAVAVPTSKDQCKTGGWRAYPQFRNQGDCVSFVREQARRACIFELVAHGRPAFRAKYGIGPGHWFAMWACVHARTGF
jgi:hypothetical protein